MIAPSKSDLRMTCIAASKHVTSDCLIADLLFDATLASTIFAPTNEAFTNAAYVLGTSVEELLEKPELVPVMLNHIIGYKIEASLLLLLVQAHPLKEKERLQEFTPPCVAMPVHRNKHRS